MTTINRALILTKQKPRALTMTKWLKIFELKELEYFANGLEGLEALNISRFDLVVCDLDLELIDGWSCIREIKAADQIPNMPVVLIGQSSQPPSAESLQEYGVTEFISWPCTAQKFQFVVQSTLSLFKTSGTIENQYTQAKQSLIEARSHTAIEQFQEIRHLTHNSGRSSIGLAQAYEQDQQDDKAADVLSEIQDVSSLSGAALMVQLRMALKTQDQNQLNSLIPAFCSPQMTPYHGVEAVKKLLAKSFIAEAAQIAQVHIERSCHMPVFYMAKIQGLVQQKQMDKALECLEQASQLFGQSIDLTLLKAESLRLKGQVQEAIQACEAGLKNAVREPRLYHELAKCHEALAEWDMAQHYLESVRHLKPDFLGIDEDLNRVQAAQRGVG